MARTAPRGPTQQPQGPRGRETATKRPKAFPKAHGRAKRPHVDPTWSTPFPEASERAKRPLYGPIPSPKPTSTPNEHHHPRRLPNDPATWHRPTRVLNGTCAPQMCPPAVAMAHERAVWPTRFPQPHRHAQRTHIDPRRPTHFPRPHECVKRRTSNPWPTQWPKHDPPTPLWPTSAPNEPHQHQVAPNSAPPCLTATSTPNRRRRPPYDPDGTEYLAPPPSPQPTLPTSTLGGPKTIRPLPPGPRARQTGHIDPEWPNPFPQAYEHAKRS